MPFGFLLESLFSLAGIPTRNPYPLFGFRPDIKVNDRICRMVENQHLGIIK